MIMLNDYSLKNNYYILYNILMNDDVVISIEDNLDIILRIIPEFKYTINFDQHHPHHHLDVYHHTLEALRLSPLDFDIRLTLLFHDISKPFQNQELDGVKHYKGHPLVSANMTVNIMERLGFEEDYIYYIWELIRYHDYPIKPKDIASNRELARKRYIIQYCDALAHNPKYLDKRIVYLDNIKKLLK